MKSSIEERDCINRPMYASMRSSDVTLNAKLLSNPISLFWVGLVNLGVRMSPYSRTDTETTIRLAKITPTDGWSC